MFGGINVMNYKRKIAYGIGNWPELVRNGRYFYVDHMAFIRELEKYRAPVFLRTRVTAADRRSYAFAMVKTDNL